MIPVFDISRVLGWAKTIILVTLLWAAFKALVIAAIAVLIPYAIYKSWNLVMEKTMDFVSYQMAGNEAWSGTFIELTGLAGWIGERLQLQACFQILATFVIMRYALSFIHKG